MNDVNKAALALGPGCALGDLWRCVLTIFPVSFARF